MPVLHLYRVAVCHSRTNTPRGMGTPSIATVFRCSGGIAPSRHALSVRRNEQHKTASKMHLMLPMAVTLIRHKKGCACPVEEPGWYRCCVECTNRDCLKRPLWISH